MYHQRDNLIRLSQDDETKKKAHDKQVVLAKENLKLSYVGPNQRQTSGTNQWIKPYARAVIQSVA